MNKEQRNETFTLQVPIDASGIEDFKPDQNIKVAAQDRKGKIYTQTVRLDEKGQGAATLNFSEQPGALRVVVGPESASDEELFGLQTISVNASGQLWMDKPAAQLTPIRISPYYWYWWHRWCRTFTIHGVVRCPNGDPVAGATVCASDVDMWWWWCSKQQVGCAVTDLNGAFDITFRWCCGWWPWWWWYRRVWRLEPYLAERIMPVLQRELRLPHIPVPSPEPDPRIFEQLLSEQHLDPRKPPVQSRAPMRMTPTDKAHAMRSAIAGSASEMMGEASSAMVQAHSTFDPGALESLRLRLAERLPVIPELERLRLWPWWPWWPWWDCTPDIIFRVTQNCRGDEKVIVDEGCWNTRWNVSSPLNVTLVANEEACCVSHPDDPEGDCLWLTDACDDFVGGIGGNIGAPATPRGYLNPGLPTIAGDRPYAGVIPIQGRFGLGAAADYYEFEWSKYNYTTSTWGGWNPMAAGDMAGFTRWYIGTPLVGPGPVSAYPAGFPVAPISGRLVVESRLHFEANNGAGSWGITRGWDAATVDYLALWLTENTFSDGTYRLRVRSWTRPGYAGNLTNPHYLPLCDTTDENVIIVTIDNRIVGAGSGHPPSAPNHPCGPGTVHLCTMEPDTDILSVKLIHADATQTDIGACGNVPIANTDTLQVDFFAYDPDGHLGWYSLVATYGENLINDLLSLGGTLTPLGAAPVPAAVQIGPSYAQARSANPPPNGGAVAPTWNGGALRLRVPAHLAFPITCCYQLELRSYKRTIVSCDHNYNQANLSEYSFMIVV